MPEIKVRNITLRTCGCQRTLFLSLSIVYNSVCAYAYAVCSARLPRIRSLVKRTDMTYQ